MRTYRKIAEINIGHNYYTKGVVADNDFVFHKTPETQKLLANYRLMLKFKPGRIEIIQECEQEDGVTEPFIEIDSELKLTIAMQLKNKQLFAFSELPFIQRGKELFFFSNKQGGKTLHEGIISTSEFIGEKDVYPLLPKLAGKIADLTWGKNKVLVNSDSTFEFEFTSPEEIQEKLIQLTDGYYEIKSGKKTELSFVLIKEKFSISDIGLIEFFIDPKMSEAILKEPLQFKIEFDTRKLKWQYQVFERFNSTKGIAIVDDGEQVEFVEQGDAELNGMKSKLFVSKQAIPLREINKQIFRIVSAKGGRSGKVWVEKLPIPKLSNIAKLSETDNSLVFKEYVYL